MTTINSLIMKGILSAHKDASLASTKSNITIPKSQTYMAIQVDQTPSIS